MIARAAALVAAVVLSLAGTATAHAARFAVGIAPNADHAAVRDQLAARGAAHIVDLAPIAALAVTADRASTLRGVPGVRYVEALGNRRQSYVPNDPLLPQQWYAAQNRSFDAWTEPPPLAAVRVAVIDSGVDGNHPELRGRIVAAKSFVKGSATVDTQGHGTFVAGLIAARTNDGIGIAGLAPPARARDREGRRPAAVDPGRGRGQGCSLGRRERRAGDQHEPQRAARSRQPEP